MNEQPGAWVVQPGQGDELHFLGISTRIKVRSETTNGAWTLIESTVEPGFAGFKPHTHQRMTEAFYILEGALSVQLGDGTMRAEPGALILVPPGVLHTYSNPSETRARYLLFMSPGGFEKYLEELDALIRATPQCTPSDLAALNALAEKYDATPS